MGFVAGVPCVAPRAQLATTASLCSKQCAESGRAAQRRSEFVPATPIGRRISAAVRFEQSASRGVVFDARGITMAARASSSTDGKKKILFVCLGNICRSPAAEAVFTHMVKERGLEEKYEIDSCGTGSWHIGKPPDTRMLAELKKAGIPAEHLRARQFSGRDFERFDLILVADDSNRRAVLNQDRDGRHAAKVKMMCDYVRRHKDKEVPDPYYEGGFDYVLDLMRDMSEGLLSDLERS